MTTIIFSLLLILFIVYGVSATLIAKAQYIRAQKYEKMVISFGDNAFKAYQLMKNIDDKQMFEKDDDVGVVFQEMVKIIEDFNDKTQSKIEE